MFLNKSKNYALREINNFNLRKYLFLFFYTRNQQKKLFVYRNTFEIKVFFKLKIHFELN